MDLKPEILDFFKKSSVPTPYLLIDLDVVKTNYERLCRAMPDTRHHYAIKANPDHQVLQTLNALSGYFEVASTNEIESCIMAGIDPQKLLYGNPLKKRKEIREAYALGVRQFVFDNILEAEKIAAEAPGSKVICRIIADGQGAVSPLTIKFGCPVIHAQTWLTECSRIGLEPYGISFHTGSQQLEPSAWEKPIKEAAEIFNALKKDNIELKVLNVGGGFPVPYRNSVLPIEDFGASIINFIAQYFKQPPIIYTEPGRYITGDAGHILSEVVLVSPNYADPGVRWVYLDIGRYGGLVEEKIDYPVTPLKPRTSKNSCVILAGQTCDSNDVIYRENFAYTLPDDLSAGEKVILMNTGAYTTTYSTTLNGFKTLKTVCLQGGESEIALHTNPSIYPDAFLKHPDNKNLDFSKLISKDSIEVHNSEEFGQGVYALKPFRKGEIIGGFAGIFTPQLLQHTLQVSSTINILDPYFIGYLQHNCEPNSRLDMVNQTVHCLKNISPGEAITMDYASTEDTLYRQFACMCNATNCRQWITGRSEEANEMGTSLLALKKRTA